MLQTIDMLLGLTVVMLVLSLLVTVMTHIAGIVSESRGRCLLGGLADLLQQIDPKLERKIALHIGGSILRHPLIQDTKWSLGTTVHREEFTKLLLDLASDQADKIDEEVKRLPNILLMSLSELWHFCFTPNQKRDDDCKTAALKTKLALAKIMEENDIVKPRETPAPASVDTIGTPGATSISDDEARLQRVKTAILDKKKEIRAAGLQLEIDKPNLPNNVRQGMALMDVAKGQLVAKINAWFDQTIDRVSSRFTARTQAMGFWSALIVVLIIQLDTIGLINRLSVDPDLRNSLVAEGIKLSDKPLLTPSVSADTALVKDNPNSLKPVLDVLMSPEVKEQNQNLQDIMQMGIINVPKSFDAWLENWSKLNPMGVVLSWILLSLGAPFWYNALKDMLKLRSTLAGKDDDQRVNRQTEQSTPTEQ